jgi:hypothetical protein
MKKRRKENQSESKERGVRENNKRREKRKRTTEASNPVAVEGPGPPEMLELGQRYTHKKRAKGVERDWINESRNVPALNVRRPLSNQQAKKRRKRQNKETKKN